MEQNPDDKTFRGLEVDYDFYFQNIHGIFVVQAQMFQKQLFKGKSIKRKLIRDMQSVSHYSFISKELQQEAIFKGQKVLCIDVSSILIKQLNLYEIDIFNMLKAESLKTDFEQKYVLVHLKAERKNNNEQTKFKIKNGIKRLFK